jgi:hypothetical protein
MTECAGLTGISAPPVVSEEQLGRTEASTALPSEATQGTDGAKWHTEVMAVPAHVTLAGDLSGEYLVEDGRLVIRPDTSAEAIRRRLGVEPISRQEFERELGHLPHDDEG